MPAASSRWRRAPTTRRCTGSSRSMRGIIPLDGFHVPARLARTVRIDALHRRGQPRFRGGDRRLRRAEARPRAAPGSTRASARSTAALLRARPLPHASRSMTATTLVGGLYGVWLGRAFFGESMFHRARDASKVALVHLVARLQGRRLPPARHAIRHRSSEDVRRGRGAAAALSQAAGSGARRRSRFRRAAARSADDAARRRWRSAQAR